MPTSDSTETTAVQRETLLPADTLRWRCDHTGFDFETTADVEPLRGVIGQDTAVESLRFGLETTARGQNVFVRGLEGTGRMTLIRQLLEDFRPTCPELNDYCYVHNFDQAQRPALVVLPPGRGRAFRRRVDHVIEFVRTELAKALAAEDIRNRRQAVDRQAEAQLTSLTEPFDATLKEAGFALMSIEAGPTTQLAIVPVVEGKPVSPEEFEQLHSTGKITDEQYEAAKTQFETFSEQFQEIGAKVQEIRHGQMEQVRGLYENAARSILQSVTRPIEREFDTSAATRFLRGLVEDVVERGLPLLESDADFTAIYRVNVIREQDRGAGCPIIVENVPTLTTLLGSIDGEMGPGGVVHSDHTMIAAGSLLRADGGYLIIEAADVITEPGAWKMLMRTLRTGRLEIIPRELSGSVWGRSLKPEPIELNVKVVLLGDGELYAMLDAADPDFGNMFKVLADFDREIARDDEGLAQYVGVLARIAQQEELPPFDAEAVGMLVEHGARIAGRAGKLTTRFGRLADLGREAAFIARKADRPAVTGDDVRSAISRTKRRADLPSRRFREYVADGTILIQVDGEAVGQINGLAVLQAGPLTYGFPARITATIGPGTAGVINIEREASLSGAIHTKGFHILRGLLRNLLRSDHPPAFSASVVFEQSYGGIDGDSASGAETCCMLSALTGVPLRQDLAMTGAIDQFGHILAIGGVNEKIEGFFDACVDRGLTGTQGVIIPRASAGGLMLREDVIRACADGRFHVYAVDQIAQALELLTGMSTGERDPAGSYPEGSLLRIAVDQMRRYWRQTITRARPSDDAD
ncbi:MAG: AAA family ATPase [Phycisphaerales bacterium]|nr:AAA family ATPase [Phycisphaerales bacterium]